VTSRRFAVEILGSDGWKDAGNYTFERATQVAELMRSGGAIVRMEGETPIRGRIRWRFEPASATWIGDIDGIELFVVVIQELGAVLYPALPGYNRQGKVCGDAPAAQDTAERVLDHFVMRIGVRGLGVKSDPSNDTLELDPSKLPAALLAGPEEGNPS
jgi:hypothetical protein